jgi:hypothetical protein
MVNFWLKFRVDAAGRADPVRFSVAPMGGVVGAMRLL